MLRRPFLSDDLFAVLNPYVTPLTLGKVLDLFSPYGATATMQSDYRPIWSLLHALQRHVFGDSAFGAYHVTNVVLHGVSSGLLVLLLVRSGLPNRWAILGGSLFLLHPANVEAVAWISQLTGVAALAFALGALLLAPRHPGLALLCFTLGILTKPLAAFALPVAALFIWMETKDRRGRLRWLAAWSLAFAAFAIVDLIVAEGAQYGMEPMHADTAVLARTIVGNFLRYLVMASTGYGLAAFHQAAPALSWVDVWWLGGAVALTLLVWRTASTLRRRRTEGIYWTWALCAFAPVSQIVPFTHPVADRYLYFILPGLIGATLLAAHAAIQSRLTTSQRTTALRLGGAVALVLLVVFAVQTHQRAGLWVSFENLARDSMRRYPDGMWAHLLHSRQAAEQGDGERSAAELRAAFELGHREYGTVVSDPVWGRVLRHPSFQRVLIDMAGYWIRRVHDIEQPNQMQLYQLASAHWLRGEFPDAKDALERALAAGGPYDERIRAELSSLRARATP